MTMTLFDEPPRSLARYVPRDYQSEDTDSFFRLADSGTVGILTRAFTGAGKTLMTCMKFDRWLQRGDNYRCMVVSYEQQLVSQFADEIAKWMGEDMRPGIEMGEQHINPKNIPQICVVSRASLVPHELATAEQKELFASMGVNDIGLCTKALATKLIRAHAQGSSVNRINDELTKHNTSWRSNHDVGAHSRLFKFDYNYNWLVAFDEAHRHVMKLRSIGMLVEWFEKNPASRRTGLTATPKRADKISIGTKMFPGVSIDYPFWSLTGKCAVTDGWAVPLKQRFINVEGVDFKSLSKVAGDYKDSELEQVLGQEEVLAKLVTPLLDFVGDRQTLIFSPGVQMAKDVAAYINARSFCECSCGTKQWHPSALIGDGAQCKDCSDFLSATNVIRCGVQAREIDGSVPRLQRTDVYEGHKKGDFQFLSVCGLCREGYDDPGISCVAIFRPVSRAASSLAEQMIGRGVRPLKGIADGKATPEERVAAIQASAKTDCLVIDLVGATGLADCSSTLSIYTEGLPDDVRYRCEEIALAGGCEIDVAETIKKAQDQIATEREAARRAREEAALRAKQEAERRSRAGAEVSYTSHEVGHNAVRHVIPPELGTATEKQRKYIGVLGLDVMNAVLSIAQAGRIISQLKDGVPIGEVKRLNRLGENVQAPPPSEKQIQYLKWKKIPIPDNCTKAEASRLIDADKNPGQSRVVETFLQKIHGAHSDAELDTVGKEIKTANLDHFKVENLILEGKRKRQELAANRATEEFF